MKILLTTVLLLITLSSNARDIQVETSLGHTNNTTHETIGIGLTGPVTQHIRWHAGWMEFGKQYINRSDTQDSIADEQAANRPGQTYPLYWMDTKRVKAIYVTGSYEWKRNNYWTSLGGGFIRYKPQVQEDLMVGEAPPPEDGRVNYSPIIELSVGYKDTSAVLSWTRIAEYRDWDEGHPNSRMITISLRQRF